MNETKKPNKLEILTYSINEDPKRGLLGFNLVTTRISKRQCQHYLSLYDQRSNKRK